MRLEDYTPDAICKAMGLGSLVPDQAKPTIRVLFKPSFHPELCITLDPKQLHVCALQSMLWHQSAPTRMPEICESVKITNSQFDVIAQGFMRSDKLMETRPNTVAIDGMSVASAYVSAKMEVNQLAGHAFAPPIHGYARQVLDLAYGLATDVIICNRIAECGWYVDAPYTPVPVEQLPKPTRIGVLGQPDDRAAFFESLERKTKEDQ